MTPIPSKNNGFVPAVGQVIRCMGGCSPRMLGKLCLVTAVYPDRVKAEYKTIGNIGGHSDEVFYTNGQLGSDEPVSEEEAKEFKQRLFTLEEKVV